MPVDPDSKFGTILKKKVNNYAYSKTYTRSSFLLLKGPKGYQAYIMTIVADSSYIKNDPAKLANNTYRQHDADFSGLVLYFTPKGKYVNGYAYQNGQLVTSASQVQSSGKTQVQLARICTDWYADVYVDNVLVASVYLYTTCTGEQDPGNSGSPAPPDPCIIVPPPPTTPPPATPNPPSTPPTGPIIPQAIPGGHLTVNNVPGGGGGFPPPLDEDDPCPKDIPPPDTTKFCNNVSLAQQQAIMNDINTFKNTDCISKVLFDILGSKITSYCVNSNLAVQAGYDPVTKGIIIKDPSTVPTNVLQEEFFHAYQDKQIPGGTAQYLGRRGGANIEFEAKVLKDLNSAVNGKSFISYEDAYTSWIYSLTDNGSFPKSFTATQYDQYKLFMANAVDPSFNTPFAGLIIDFNLAPTSMFTLINSLPCSN